MKTLVIYAHPPTKGFCSYILNRVKKELSERKESFEVIDLYEINYQPVLKEEELYTAGNDKVSEENKKFQKKIKQAEKLIFIYPVWWASMPAVLKGFLDRVLTPGFAYNFEKQGLISAFPNKLLDDKEALVFQTLGGPRWAYFLTGNPPKRVIKLFTLWFAGISTKVIQIFNANKLTEKRKESLENIVQVNLKRFTN